MAKFIVIVLLVLIDIFNAIKYRNEQQQTRNSITEAKMCWLSAKESGNVANKRIDALKRALNEQAIIFPPNQRTGCRKAWLKLPL